MPIDHGAAVRAFFALWPEEAARSATMAAARSMHAVLGGRLTRADSLHLTLVFLGDVPVARLEALARVGAGVAFEPFVLALDRAGCWPHNGIGWLAPAAVPPPLSALVGALRARVEALGVEAERRAYVPHVTVVRKARCAPLPMLAPIEWRVRDFVLVRSTLAPGGSAYEIIGRWPAAFE
jgi:RNA 2',3'-cyclic 3'-phosphodiesterase